MESHTRFVFLSLLSRPCEKLLHIFHERRVERGCDNMLTAIWSNDDGGDHGDRIVLLKCVDDRRIYL